MVDTIKTFDKLIELHCFFTSNHVLNYYNYMTKKNPNLTAEQKLVMFEDGTESPGTSELNHCKNEKRDLQVKGSYHCANCGIT